MKISAIITVHNEGEELARTVRSIRDNTRQEIEIVVVDDESTDGWPQKIEPEIDKLIVREQRVGIGDSRNLGTREATGDVLAYFDAHQRVTKGCIDDCAALAVERQAIVWPCVRGLIDKGWTGHGCALSQERKDNKRGLFVPVWNRKQPRDKISRCSSCYSPGYVMTREVYNIVRWIDGMKGFGANEPVLAVKAFFAEIDHLHLCGHLARHEFRNGKIPYRAKWKDTATNHALIARICFSHRTWAGYWRAIFRPHLGNKRLKWLETSKKFERQRQEFKTNYKKRPDSEFWRGLLLHNVPRGVYDG